MAKYVYTAKTKDSKTIRDSEEALSKEELALKLRNRGLFIISIFEEGKQEQQPSLFSSLIQTLTKTHVKRGSITLYDLASFSRNLATTLSSGVTLLRSLDILSHQTESAGLEKILQACSERIKNGASLSEAIAQYPRVFNLLWQGIIEVGEASGTLPTVLDRLADYLEMRLNFERKIKSAMVYPMILVCAGIAAITFFFKFILPKFVNIFKSMNVELPLPTKIIFEISTFVDKNFISIVLVIGLAVLLMFIFRTSLRLKQLVEDSLYKIPFVGNFLFLLALERFTSTMYILLDSGLPLVYGLDVAARGCGNRILEKKVLYVRDRVKDGSSLSQELNKAGVFPILIYEMAKIGEETGSLPEIFKRISSQYQRDLATQLERIVAAFEPAMIVFMGLIIGGIVISLFLPMFKLIGAVSAQA